MLNFLLKHIFVFLIFCGAVTYITFPLVMYPGEIATGTGDELVIAWIQNWVIHSFITGNLLNIFDANLYYPFQNSLAYSDTFFISSLISLFPVLIIGEPIVAHNVTLIISLIFLGFSIYTLAYYITKEVLPSLLAGVLVIFSPAVLSNTTHVQMLAIAGVPLAILFFHIFLEKQKTKYFLLSLVCFLLQTYNSFLPGYFIIFSYIILFISYWIGNRNKVKKIITLKNLIITAVTALLLLPVILPYYQVAKEFNYVRDIRDAIHFALQPEDLLYPGSTTRLQPLLLELIPSNNSNRENTGFKPGYIGFVFSLLCLLTIFYIIKYWKKNNFYTRAFSIISLTGLLLSLGPALHLFRHTIHEPFPIPLPYAILYYIAPGFQGFRNSARWEMLFILSAAIVIVIILKKLLLKHSSRTRIIVYTVLLLGVIGEYNFPMQYVNIPKKETFPEVYSWLDKTSEQSKIIHMPIYNWGMWPYTQQELWREYYGTVHFRKTVNGYTGFSPPPWQELVNTLFEEFPETDTIKILKELKLTYIVIDKNEYNKLYSAKLVKRNGDAIVEDLKKNQSLELFEELEQHVVFKVK